MDIHHFSEAFDFVMERLSGPGPFALTRFGDGELAILENEPVGNKEFQYDGDEDFHKSLWEAFTYSHSDYYAGICCPCCIPIAKCQWMVDKCGSDFDHITYNNIFVNANYSRIEEFIDLLNDHGEVPLVICNEEGCHKELPFLYSHFGVPKNAWRFVDDITERLIDWPLPSLDDAIILVAAGPASEVIIHRCFQACPNNRYVDVGSLFDTYLFGHGTRGYSSGGATASKVCTLEGLHA